jgi:hypothetical protein
VYGRRPWVLLACVLAAAAAIRVGYVATANVEVSTGYQFDMSFYREAGQRLAEGGGYTFHDVPTAAWPPGYPAFIAAAHLMSDAPIATVQRWQVALGTLPCLLVVLIAALVAVPTALVRSCPSRLLLPITIAWLTALHAIVLFGDPRFHFPLLPVFAVLASETLVGGWLRVRDRCRDRRTRPSMH